MENIDFNNFPELTPNENENIENGEENYNEEDS